MRISAILSFSLMISFLLSSQQVNAQQQRKKQNSQTSKQQQKIKFQDPKQGTIYQDSMLYIKKGAIRQTNRTNKINDQANHHEHGILKTSSKKTKQESNFKPTSSTKVSHLKKRSPQKSVNRPKNKQKVKKEAQQKRSKVNVKRQKKRG